MRRVSVLLIVLVLASLLAVPSWSQERGPASLLQYGDGDVQYERLPGTQAPRDREWVLLIDQQPNQSNGIFSDVSCDLCGGAQVLADAFVLTADAAVSEVVFWTGYYPADVPIDPDMLRVIIHQDGGGIPGAVLYDEVPVSYTRFQTGVILFGVHEWQHTLTLASPVALGPGTYWIEIFNDTGWGTDDFFWEVGNLDPAHGLLGSAYAFEAPGALWYIDGGQDLSFQLWGESEPPPPCEWETLFFDDFEGGYGNWAMDGLWNPEAEADVCGSMVAPFPSSANDAYFGIDGVCTYETGYQNIANLAMTLDVNLTDAVQAEVNFWSYEQTECNGNCSFDKRYVQYSADSGGTWATAATLGTENTWYNPVVALPSGGPLRVRFQFDDVDGVVNSYFGWMVDNVEVRGCFPVSEEKVFATHVLIIPLPSGTPKLLLGLIRAATGNGATPVVGASVDATWTLPIGGYVVPQTKTTNAKGFAFPVMLPNWTGTYVLDLVSITAEGYTYDPDMNWDTSASWTKP